jgi:ABC-2 type transport system permease protein
MMGIQDVTSSKQLPDLSATPELQDVSGPGALSGGWRRMWELTLLLATTEFQRTYFGTVLGYVWSVGRPLLLFAVLVEVFTHIFHLGSQVQHYPVFLLLNIVLFGFFQEATALSVTSIVSHEGIVRKTQFPRLAIPLAVVVSALFNLALNLVVVFVFILAFGVTPTWTWLLLPVVVGLLAIVSLAIAMILSSLYPRFRDLGIIWTVFSTALFYATPVLYTVQTVSTRSHSLGKLIALNPIAPILELARRWIISPGAPYPGSASAGGPAKLAIAAGIIVALCVLAVWVFGRQAPRIAEEL